MDNTDQIAAALAVAQGQNDRESEGRLLARMVRPVNRILPMPARFFFKIAMGMSDCWYWTGCVDKRLGYGVFHCMGEVKAHRVAWRLFYGDIPEGMMVLHKCDVRNCVNPEHLFLGTQTDNMRDMAAKGRANPTPRPGESNWNAKLSDANVKAIRAEYAAGGISMKRLALKWNVISPMTICRIVNRQTWRHI